MLLIEQGKHAEEERSFEVIVENGVTLQITKVALSQRASNVLEVTMKVIKGKAKNRLVWDRVSFDPNDAFAWKYLALRRAAGVPYSKTEGAKVDIEKLLVNKALVADLAMQTGKDGNEYQRINYKTPKKEEKPTTPAEDNDDTDEDELPFEVEEAEDTSWD